MAFIQASDFPITGILREPMLALEITIAFFCFECCFMFIIRYIQQVSKTRTLIGQSQVKAGGLIGQLEEYLTMLKNRDLGWGGLFFFLMVMYSIFVISDYYATTPSIRRYFLFLGYLSYFLGIACLAYTLEKNELNHPNFPYTRIILGYLSCYFFTTIYSPANTVVLTSLSLPFLIAMLIEFGKVIISRSEGIRNLALPVYGLFLGLILLLLGFFATTDYVHPYIGWYGRLVGDLLQFLAVLLFAIAFYFLPSFSEFDWIDKIKALFVVHPSGISIFSHTFHIGDTDTRYEADLTTGAIVAIKAIVQDMSTKSKAIVRSIKKENFTMLLEYGQHVICVLLAEEDSVSLRQKLGTFCRQFEQNFHDQLQSWYGNVSQFESTSQLVKKIFTAE